MSHVDSTSPVTHVSLCAGYGGIDLGLHRAIRNLRTIAVSEIEAFACANLVAKMEAGLLDPAPIWTDLKTFPWSDFRDRVDILSGGYPCQPFSAAGKRLGAEDPRHLWPHISAGIALMRPAVCFFENVEGHISLGLPDVIEDLGRLGYRATWCVASASECGAPHQRKRIWILAERNDQRSSLAGLWQQSKVAFTGDNAGEELAYRHGVRLQQYATKPDRRHWEDLQEQPQGGCASELALTSSIGSAAGIPRPQQGHEGIAGVADNCGDQAWPSRPGEQQFAWEPPRVVADAGRRKHGGRQDGAWPIRGTSCEPPKTNQSLGNAAHANRRPRVSAEEAGAGPDDIWRRRSGESGEREIIKPMGLHLDGAPDGLGVAELSGLSDQELAEIRHWMVASDNRTDELRLLGNGVVPACAERAFRLLFGELMEATT